MVTAVRLAQLSRAMFKLNLRSRWNRVMPNGLSRTVLFLARTLTRAFVLRWLRPFYRVGQSFQRGRLGDLNNDQRWDQEDHKLFQALLTNPFRHRVTDRIKTDLIDDGRLGAGDLAILEHLSAVGDPCESEAELRATLLSGSGRVAVFPFEQRGWIRMAMSFP